jgi:hypothetical protein
MLLAAGERGRWAALSYLSGRGLEIFCESSVSKLLLKKLRF